jgi:sulfate adenylyltransferase
MPPCATVGGRGDAATAHDQEATVASGHTLHGDDLAWLELMVTGAYPAGYASPADAARGPGRVPVLRVPADVARSASTSGQLALLDPEGVTVGSVAIAATGVDPAGHWLSGVPSPGKRFAHLSHRELRVPPATCRSRLAGGPVIAWWDDPEASVMTRGAVATLAQARGGVVLQLVGVPSDHETDRAGHRAVRLALAQTTRTDRDHLVVVPDPGLGWTEADLATRAAIAAAYGATAVAVPVEHAGSGGPRAATVELLVVDVAPEHAGLDGAALDALLDTGSDLPSWFAEPTVAAELRRWHRPRHQQGFTVLFTGFSGSGKSTVARTLVGRLLDREDRSVSLLDGDVVRHHLSKGLGFSRADRDTNVRRIGYVASEITKAGGIAVAAPIAPYAATRADVRRMVAQHGGFVLVHVSTPLAECERRDRKGLYAKARAGEIPEFTGISDPYEVPQDADVVVDTTDIDVETAVEIVLARLVDLGYLTP